MTRAWVLTLLMVGCGTSEESARVALRVMVEGTHLAKPTVTDLGYEITLTRAQLALADIELTVAGELHASWSDRIGSWLVRRVHAHPGHLAAGEITGELKGRFVVDWLEGDGVVVGEATLLTGEYSGANFTFARAGSSDGVEPSDPLFGHTATLAGEASRGDKAVQFSLAIDSPEDRELIGAPFAASVNENATADIGFRFCWVDEVEGDNIFDGVDFAALDDNGDGTLLLTDEGAPEAAVTAYHRVRRAFQTHDHFAFRLKESR